MKLAILSLLLPVTSMAADVTCDSLSFAGAPIQISLRSTEDIALPGSKLKIEANGTQQIIFSALVDSTARPSAEKLSLKITTLNQHGVKDDFSGAANLDLNLERDADRENVTGGLLHVTKPPRGTLIRIIGAYELTNCRGSL